MNTKSCSCPKPWEPITTGTTAACPVHFVGVTAAKQEVKDEIPKV